MRYRKLSPTGDYVFGHSQVDFLVNTPETVAQAIETSLRLWLGEWYLNINDGTPYLEGILGYHSQDMADANLKARIENVQGVVNISEYSSSVDPVTRKYSATCTVNTLYGPTQVEIQNLGNF
jgi:hypothetical protein